MSDARKFQCTICREAHVSPTGYSYEFTAPDPWPGIPEEQQDENRFLAMPVCRISEFWFVRTCMQIPIRRSEDFVLVGLWVSVVEANLQAIASLDDEPLRIYEESFACRLANEPIGFPNSFNLKARLHLQELGKGPLIFVDPCEHPIYSCQQNGISVAKAWEILSAKHHRFSR